MYMYVYIYILESKYIYLNCLSVESSISADHQKLILAVIEILSNIIDTILLAIVNPDLDWGHK
jgi:hypothetical protein